MKLRVYEVSADGLTAPFFVLGHTPAAARGNAAEVLSVHVREVQRDSALERVMMMSPEELERVRQVLQAAELAAVIGAP